MNNFGQIELNEGSELPSGLRSWGHLPGWWVCTQSEILSRTFQSGMPSHKLECGFNPEDQSMEILLSVLGQNACHTVNAS